MSNRMIRYSRWGSVPRMGHLEFLGNLLRTCNLAFISLYVIFFLFALALESPIFFILTCLMVVSIQSLCSIGDRAAIKRLARMEDRPAPAQQFMALATFFNRHGDTEIDQGSDYGLVTYLGGLMYFEGERCSFAISSDLLKQPRVYRAPGPFQKFKLRWKNTANASGVAIEFIQPSDWSQDDLVRREFLKWRASPTENPEQLLPPIGPSPEVLRQTERLMLVWTLSLLPVTVLVGIGLNWRYPSSYGPLYLAIAIFVLYALYFAGLFRLWSMNRAAAAERSYHGSHDVSLNSIIAKYSARNSAVTERLERPYPSSPELSHLREDPATSRLPSKG